MGELHLRNLFVVLIVIAILASIFIANITIPKAIEKIQCEENGGDWADMIDGGCAMTSKVCEEAGGTPTKSLHCRIFTEMCPEPPIIRWCSFEGNN